MRDRGFTLVELMIVVSIIAVLAAIVIPVIGQLVRKAQEADTKGNLGNIRSALSIYYGDNEGTFPHDMNALTVDNKYLSGIPMAYYPTHHRPGTAFLSGGLTAFLLSSTDLSPWFYFDETDPVLFGTVVANCIHTDARGNIWTTY